MKAEGIYVRQSKDKKESLSIQGQTELCRRECRRPDAAEIYTDRGYSGKNTARPGFQSMMKDVRDGKISRIVVYRLDRLSRSIIDFGQMWSELERYQVEFVSVNEKFDTSTPMGRAMIYIIMVFAQLERETIGERVTDNYYERVRQGNWPGGTAPFGMKNIRLKEDEGKGVPSLEYKAEFAVAREIFYRYAQQDISLGQIAADLTVRGIPCGKRAGWDNTALSRILHSPVYVQADEKVYLYYMSRGVTNFSHGIDSFDGSYSANVVGKRPGGARKYTDLKDQVVSLTNFEGRIPSDIWLSCQYRLEKNSQIGNTGKGSHTWLSGLIKCGECGYSLTVRVWKEKKYLYCSGRGNLHICDKKSFSPDAEVIETAVRKELERVLKACGDDMICEENNPKKKDDALKIQELEEQIGQLLKSIKDAPAAAMRYISQEIGRLDEKKQELIKFSRENQVWDGERERQIIFEELSFEEKKLAAQTFIDRIHVFDERIEIVWNI